MENLKISVVIPVHNGEKTLNQCLTSVISQTYKNYEVIVVDNNSTDNTKEIIKRFQTKSEKVKYIFESKRGRGAARNKGIEVSEGDVIATTDSDCIVPKDWIEEIIKPIIYENENIVMGSEKDIINNYWTKNIQKATQEFVKRNLRGKYIEHIDTKNFAIKKSIMRKWMFNPEIKNSDDLDLFIRLRDVERVRFLPSLKVSHNHKNSFTNIIKLYFDRGFWALKIYKLHKKRVPALESVSFKNFILFPFWMVLQFTKNPLGEAYFTLVSELSWRAGIILALIKC